MKWIIKLIKKLFRKNKKTRFYWFDITTYQISEIDQSVIDPNGQPCPPIECVRVKEGTIIEVYGSKHRNTEHVCIGGRALSEDAKFGLYSQSDFDYDNYHLIKKFTIQLI